MADLLEHLRDHLVAEGLVELPNTNGPLPALVLEPRDGAPGPGAGAFADEELVVSAFIATGIPSQRHEGFVRIDAVDLWLRATSPRVAVEWEELLVNELHDKRGWDMAGLRVEETLQFRALQRLSSSSAGWTFTTEYLFERWAEPAHPG